MGGTYSTRGRMNILPYILQLICLIWVYTKPVGSHVSNLPML